MTHNLTPASGGISERENMRMMLKAVNKDKPPKLNTNESENCKAA